MRTLLTMWVVAGLMGTFACGSSDDAKKKSVDLNAEVTRIDGLVPDNLKDQVKFKVWKEKRKGSMQAVVPDWKDGYMDGAFELGDAFDRNTFSVGSNCDGECKPKDWAAIAEKVNFENMGNGEVEKDEPLPEGGRIVIKKTPGGRALQLAMWRKDSRKYYTCSARLRDPISEAIGAFEQACRSIVVESW